MVNPGQAGAGGARCRAHKVSLQETGDRTEPGASGRRGPGRLPSFVKSGDRRQSVRVTGLASAAHRRDFRRRATCDGNRSVKPVEIAL